MIWLPIHVFSMPDTDNFHDKNRLKEVIDNPVVSDSNPVSIFGIGQLLHSMSEWVGFETFNGIQNSLLILVPDLPDLFNGGFLPPDLKHRH